MKLYKDISRFQFRRIFSKGSHYEKRLLWGLSLNQGDLFCSCSGFNVRVKDIEIEKGYAKYHFGRSRPSKNGWYIADVVLIDYDGGYHSVMHCCAPKETPKQIEEYFKDLTKDERFMIDWGTPRLLKIKEKLERGEPICDEHGIELK